MQALPIENIDRNALPESLAFVDGFVDPGNHFQLSVGPEWELAESAGIEQAPTTQWWFGDIGMQAGSLPLPGVALAEFTEGLAGELLYVDDERAVISRPISETESSLSLFILDAGRLAFVGVGFENSSSEEALQAVLQPMATLTRTPFGEADLGEPSDTQVRYWLGQFDTMSNEDRARYGTPEHAASCIAGGMASPRITRYPQAAIDPNQIDINNQLQTLTYGNYQADLEEMLAYCGLPAGSLGTWNAEATYNSDFLDQNLEQMVRNEFPQAAANFETQGIDVREFTEALCETLETTENIDELETDLLALEPAGVFSGDEDFGEFVGAATASLCRESFQSFVDRVEVS